MVKIRSMPNNDNKTPNAVLHEQVKKMKFKLEYDMPTDLNVGPFTVTCTVTSSNGDIVYAEGTAEASSKKEAKQKASAAAIEMLLVTVNEEEFMTPGRSRV